MWGQREIKSEIKNSWMSVENPEISGTHLLMKALSCGCLCLAAILFENGGMDGNRFCLLSRPGHSCGEWPSAGWLQPHPVVQAAPGKIIKLQFHYYLLMTIYGRRQRSHGLNSYIAISY
jgi:hypothetical protein